MSATPLLIDVLRRPEASKTLKLAEWDLLIRQARSAHLLASLGVLLEERGLKGHIPDCARRHFNWSRVAADRHVEAVRWEVAQICNALENLRIPVILLKGAAYAMAELPPARGRLFADIDILVPKERLADVEAALMLHGWVTTHHDEYDQRYYRQWMHELPPLQHVKRMTVIDVHHAILPETAEIRPDPAKLRAAARSIITNGSLKILSPVDMVLHSAAHLFHEAESDKALRDLFDIHSLLAHFCHLPSFWSDLADRADELQLERSLFYALRYCWRLFHSSIPDNILAADGGANNGRPNNALLALMEALYLHAFMPRHSSCERRFSAAARFLLYVRGNWLRMPPLLLGRHLFRKAFISGA